MIFHHLARRQNRFRSVAAVIAAAGIAQGGLWDDSKDLTNSADEQSVFQSTQTRGPGAAEKNQIVLPDSGKGNAKSAAGAARQNHDIAPRAFEPA